MARFATAAASHNVLDPGQGMGNESQYIMSPYGVPWIMFSLNQTAVELLVSTIQGELDSLAPFICEGKVSPFTPACVEVAARHSDRLRVQMSAFKIQLESARGLQDLRDESLTNVNFGTEGNLGAQGLGMQMVDAVEPTRNFGNEEWELAYELKKNCKYSSRVAEEMCSRARPLARDEFIMKLAVSSLACIAVQAIAFELTPKTIMFAPPTSNDVKFRTFLAGRKTEVALLHQDIDRLRGMRKEHESSLALNEAAGKTKCAHAIIATDELTKSMMEVTQEQVELHEAFISVFEKAIKSASEAAIYNLTGPWEELRVVANEPMKELLDEFARSLYGMFEACDIARDKDEVSGRIAHDEL
ncbi:hypothetical protein LTR17_007319 [Elasticomyces elasticus]|nr:hypothetical protein LTR17_007319 [Elasticomyces elasticus]